MMFVKLPCEKNRTQPPWSGLEGARSRLSKRVSPGSPQCPSLQKTFSSGREAFDRRQTGSLCPKGIETQQDTMKRMENVKLPMNFHEPEDWDILIYIRIRSQTPVVRSRQHADARIPASALFDQGGGPGVWSVHPATGQLILRSVAVDHSIDREASSKTCFLLSPKPVSCRRLYSRPETRYLYINSLK